MRPTRAHDRPEGGGVALARRLPVGAEVRPGGTHFRVWAPGARGLEVVLDGSRAPLAAEAGGYFSGFVPGVAAGDRYRYGLDGELFPDPASRFQPEGPHGPSEVVDPRFEWTDQAWPGATLEGQVLYELHVGTFTPEGTFEAAARELPALAELGVTCIEVMPVAEFPGRFGWGYDGVALFAPTRLYGRPEDLRRLVDRAHALGLAVILDVVYNHLGPDGNHLPRFGPYFSTRHEGEWGRPFDLDRRPVRDFLVANAGYWLDEFHVDGLRLDATQGIFDDSKRHLVAEIAERVHARRAFVIAENEPQDARLVREHGCDGMWNDDFHHSARVALTGQREAYYQDYLGTPAELLAAARHGFLYQGQPYRWQKKRRGTPARDLPSWAFVCFLENHDQVANSLEGKRLVALASPGRLRALTTLLLLGPWTPLLFQGQERFARSPFLYFADHHPELARLVRAGRADFMGQFPSIEKARLHDPADPGAFERSKLRDAGSPQALALHRDLLRLRRTLEGPVDGAVLGSVLLLRWPSDLLVLNLGTEARPEAVPEPLLGVPPGWRFEVTFSSEDPAYGGSGARPREDAASGWIFPGEMAAFLRLLEET